MHKSIYQPSEDTFFFSDFLKDYLTKNKLKKHLDMGTGSSHLAEITSNFLKKENIASINLKLDINFLSMCYICGKMVYKGFYGFYRRFRA